MNRAEYVGIEALECTQDTFMVRFRPKSAITVNDLMAALVKLVEEKSKEYDNVNAS